MLIAETNETFGVDAMMIASVVLAALGYLTLAGKRNPRNLIVGLSLLAASVASVFLRVSPSSTEWLFFAFTCLASGGTILFLLFRQPVHSALGFAVTVLSTVVLFFMVSAPFVAAATMMIYAGATIIVFLFVLMFAQKPFLEQHDLRLNAPLASVILACLLCMMLLNAILAPGALPPPAANTDRPSMAMPNPDRHGTVAELGRVMFGHYLWTVELAGTLLLVAGIGAIAIAQQEPEARA